MESGDERYVLPTEVQAVRSDHTYLSIIPR